MAFIISLIYTASEFSTLRYNLESRPVRNLVGCNFISVAGSVSETRFAGESADTPGGAVHAQLQRIKRQLSAVQGGEEVHAVQIRTMLTPPPIRLTPAPSLARPGTASTVGTARTPLSALNSVANEQGEYWHRRCAHDHRVLLSAQPVSCTFRCIMPLHPI